MIVSWNWLKEYVRLDMSIETLTDRLMMAGLNLEDFSDVDGDIAIDLEVTSNRPDCLCHLGIACEVGVLFDREVQLPGDHHVGFGRKPGRRSLSAIYRSPGARRSRGSQSELDATAFANIGDPPHQ